MSVPTEPAPLRLHQQHPAGVLPRDGEPYPDDELHRRRPRPPRTADGRRAGADAAAVLGRHRLLTFMAGALRAGLQPTSDLFAWFAAHAAARLQLRAFTDVAFTDVAEGAE